MFKRVFKLGLVLLGLLLLAALGLSFWAYRQISGSLPQLDGEIQVTRISAPVMIERDSLGIPTIRAKDRIDLAYATGFAHGQDRFFQMDLLRRNAAGELAELIGPPLVEQDRQMRFHRFRSIAHQKITNENSEDREWLSIVESYTEGVNAGLNSLKKPPFEYLVLRSTPQPWKPEDSLLVMYSMFLDLQGDQFEAEVFRGVLHDSVPEEMYEFLMARGNQWDAPMQGEALEVPAIPGPDVMDVRKFDQEPSQAPDAEPRELPKAAGLLPQGLPAFQPDALKTAFSFPNRDDRFFEGYQLGSNNWAVSGKHTADGRALVADDMHLGIRVPHVWYRASFVWQDESQTEHRITGVTLPGTPAMVVGSNGHIAWGFTNTEGDWLDAVIIDVDPNNADQYLTPDGPKKFETHQEVIKVKDAADEALDVVSTIWGPIAQKDHKGRPLAAHWVAYDEEGANIGLMQIESIHSIEDALTQANLSGSPHQNFVVADSGGRIAWTILGRIPRRIGHDGRLPRSWADGSIRWDGYREPSEYPRIVDPEVGRIWSANARVAGGKDYEIIGDSGYDCGARQQQIRDRLLELDKATDADMLELQLDDRALFLEPWQKLLLSVLDSQAAKDSANPTLVEFRKYVADWSGHASVDSVSYRAVSKFRTDVIERLDRLLGRPAAQADPKFTLTNVRRIEGPFWKVVSERPAHFLDPDFESWDAWLLASADNVIDEATKDGRDLSQFTWGEINTTRIQHPLSQAIPAVAPWLDMPYVQMPGGWTDMPRIQTPRGGASQRMAVSPGKEEDGYMHMPCGQSGHPLSPHYADSHPAWVLGKASPFLPGPAIHTLTLKPSK